MVRRDERRAEAARLGSVDGRGTDGWSAGGWGAGGWGADLARAAALAALGLGIGCAEAAAQGASIQIAPVDVRARQQPKPAPRVVRAAKPAPRPAPVRAAARPAPRPRVAVRARAVPAVVAPAPVAVAGPGAGGATGSGGAGGPAGTGFPNAAPSTGDGARGSGIGYFASRSQTATRTDTPLRDVPQSVTVVTRDRIRDQSFQSVTDLVRYVPGIVPSQGEGNRDEVVFRGQRTNADFFVNGIRDDAQYLRDLYNINRVEVLKGPNAMIFGRGGGGGVINRVLKEADGLPVRDIFLQGGSFGDRRLAIDVSDAVSSTIAGRLNAFYENTDSYRRFVNIERYGINPTVTIAPDAATSLRLSYEHFHDERTADRGIPSQFGRPYNYRANRDTFFGNPALSFSRVDADILTAVLEHQTDSGLTIRSQSRFANYEKFYQNVFPGGAVNAAGTSVNLSAYNNEADRQNLFNQTDFIYKFNTGFLGHTLLAGFEVGRQSGLAFRQDGFFNDRTQTLAVSPLFPISFAPITFRNLSSGANNTYALNLAAGYVQDQIVVTDQFQIIAGLRYDHFDLSSLRRDTGVTQSRIDDLVSPRIGAVVKPVEEVSIYASYSVSYLPSAGDQFSTLNPGLVIAEPEKFVNKEVGVKWDVAPRLQINAALYELDRTNQRLADPNNPGYFLLSGATNTKGFEIGANGYLTDWWQVAGGYAYTDARIAANLSSGSTTILAGNTVGLVPFNAVTLWNRFQITPRFGVGLGVINQTHTFASSDNTVRLPGFTRVDAALFYQVNANVRAQINVENVLDRHYILTADNNNNITPGSPRAVRFALIASF